MNREQIHQEFEKVRNAFKRVDGNFKNVDIHIGENIRRLLKMEKTVDEMYLNAMTRDRMWTCLMELVYRKGIFTKTEFDDEINLLNQAIEKAVEAEKAKKAQAEVDASLAASADSSSKVTVVSDVPAIPVIK